MDIRNCAPAMVAYADGSVVATALLRGDQLAELARGQGDPLTRPG